MPKKPFGFILENVEGLVTHDREDKKDKIGRTLRVILSKLEGLGYKVTWKVLNSKDFGLAQERKRIYIVGTLDEKVSLDKFEKSKAVLADVLQKGQPTIETDFTRLLLSHFKPEELYGKSIKDKRGGNDNIHSWDIEMKQSINTTIQETPFQRPGWKRYVKAIGISMESNLTFHVGTT